MRYLFLICIIIPQAINAQNLELSYNEAVRIGIEQNVTLQTQKNDRLLVKAERDQSKAELAPTLSANMRGFISNGNWFNKEEARTINTTSENVTAGLSANLNVFSGLSQINMIKLRNANYAAQNQLIKRTSQDVVFTVTNQYLEVLLSVELLEIAKSNLENQEILYKQIEAMVTAGNKPKSDLFDQLATVKSRELLVLQAKNNLTNNISTLAVTLQLDPTVNITVANPGWNINEILLLDTNLDSLYDIALVNRPDIKQYEFNEQVTRKAVAVAKASFSPSIYAYYGFGTAYNNLNERTFSQQFTVDKKGSEYGLQMSIPIFTGLRNRTQLVNYKVSNENAKLNTENLKKTILNDVRNAYQNFQDIKTAYEVSLAQFEAADMALKVQNEKYQLGVGSLIELTNSNNNYVLAASRRAQAQLNLMFQKIILDYHTGTLVIPSVEN